MKRATWKVWALLGALLLAACGQGPEESPGAEASLDTAAQELDSAACRTTVPVEDDPNAPKGLDMVCNGPWEYRRVCPQNLADAYCPYTHPTYSCTKYNSCRYSIRVTHTETGTASGRDTTTQTCDNSRKPPCTTSSRTTVTKTCAMVESEVLARLRTEGWEDSRYPLTASTTTGTKVYGPTQYDSYPDDFGSTTITIRPWTQTCTVTVSNKVQSWHTGEHAECGSYQTTCTDTNVRNYQPCRAPEHPPESDPAACDGLPGFGVFYSQAAISRRQLAVDDPKADLRDTTGLSNRPRCLTAEETPYSDVDAKFTKLKTQLDAAVPAGVDGPRLKVSLINALKLLFERHGESPALDTLLPGTTTTRRDYILGLYTSHPEVNKVSRVDNTLDFTWNYESPSPSIFPESFSTRWTGYVDVFAEGEYVFNAQTDDGFRLWVDGQLVIDSWIGQAPTWYASAPLYLFMGPHELKVEYYEGGGGATARLLWTPPGASAPEVIPNTQLYTPDMSRNGLLAEYFDNVDFTSTDCGLFQAPRRDGECAGVEAVNKRLAMCHRMTQGHVSPAATSFIFNSCVDILPTINAIPTTCDRQKYRDLWSTISLSLLKKNLASLHATDTTEQVSLQKKLDRLDRWYLASRASIHANNAKADVLNKELSDAVGAFWRGAYNSRKNIGIKPGESANTVALPADDLPGLTTDYLAVDRTVVKALFNTVESKNSAGTPVIKLPLPSAPLLLVLGDAFKGMNQRLAAVSATHDLGCRFRQCGATLVTTEVSELWRLLGTLPADPTVADPNNLVLTLEEALLTSPKVRQDWKDVFTAIKDRHDVLRGAVVSAQGGTYSTGVLANTALNQLAVPALDLARLVRDARYRSENYKTTGRFDSVARNVLHTGMNREKETEIDSVLNTRSTELTNAINTYINERATLVSNLVGEMRATRTQASITEGILLKEERFRQLEKDLSGLQHLSRLDAARHADFVRGFNAAINQTHVADFQVSSRPVQTVMVGASLARYTASTPAASDHIANLGTGFMRQAGAGDVLHFQVSGLWGPTCAMRTPQLNRPWDTTGSLVAVTDSGILTGPEGFMLSYSNNAYSQRSMAQISERGTYTNLSVADQLCVGVHVEAGTPGIVDAFSGVSASVYADASRCLGAELGARTSETESSTSTNGIERSSAAAFSAGVRLTNTPFPLLPAGSLVLVEVARGQVYRSAIKQLHVLQRPAHSIVVNGDHDLYLVVNDKGGCSGINASQLTVAVSHAERLGTSTGTKARELLAAMTSARQLIVDRTPAYVAAGRITAQDLASLRTDAHAKLQEGLTYPAADLPTHLKGLFDAWVEVDLAALVRRLEMLAVERELTLLTLELKALRDDLQRTAGESRLMRLLPVWSLRNLEASELDVKMYDLAQAVSDYLYPTIHLRYPGVFSALSTDSAANTAMLALTDGGEGTRWDDSYVEIARQVQTLVGRVKTHLDTERLKAAQVPATAEFPIKVLSFPRPGYAQPSTFPEWRTVDDARARQVWDAALDPTRNMVSFTVLPEDLYRLNGGDSMTCNEGAMVIRSMALYVSRRYQPDGNTLTEYYRQVPAKVDSTMTFVTLPGPEVYEQLNTGWLGSYVYPVFGEPHEAITQFKQYAKAYRKGNGLSPFGRFDFNFVELRNWTVAPLDLADQLMLVFEVETQNLGSDTEQGSESDMTWINTCR